MTTLDELIDEDWRIIVDEFDLNEPTICYPDRDRRGAFVGPVVTIPIGTTITDEEGNEVLELDGPDGRTLAAVACLPQFAELLRWIRQSQEQLNPIHFDSQTECGRFMRELRDRANWITSCVNDREETMGAGEHGFDRFKARRAT